MSRVNWRAVHADEFGLPDGVPLPDLTAELTTLLGDTDPHLRSGVALPVLSNWVAKGVYDDLLTGLGDGMAAGLRGGVGRTDDDSVFRRSFSALGLARCIARDNERPLVAGGKVLDWGDRIATWLLAERDLRGWVPGKGWARAVGHGADALAVLAASPHCGAAELTVLLDVVAERVTSTPRRPIEQLLPHGETDRLARTVLAVLRRERVPFDIVEAWLASLVRVTVEARERQHVHRDPDLDTGDAESFLRALYLQLAVGPRPPGVRADLLLLLVDALRTLHPDHLATGPSAGSRR